MNEKLLSSPDHESSSLLRESRASGGGGMATFAPIETGLSEEEAERRLRHFGKNCLEEKEVNMFLKFCGYFWGPMPIMIWCAAFIEMINDSWVDLVVLLLLQAINGFVGFYEEKNAGDAIAALKASLTPKCTVRRASRWRTMDSSLLVPGDVVNLKLGDIIPADVKLGDGQPLQVDQAALTGESLPVTLYPHDSAKMGATVKRGEIEAHVTATGSNTFFGKAASMVNSVENVSRFQKVNFKITMILLVMSVVSTAAIMVVLLNESVSLLRAMAICVVLLVASIPIAMQVVSTSTMAVGARKLSELGVIVARLGAIEEMAGMDMLCSDKTGTLTQNKLKLYEPILVDQTISEKDLIFISALAAKRMEEGMDAIDTAVVNACLADPDSSARLAGYQELDFVPFDPTSKKTVSTVRNISTGATFKCCKGMTNVVLGMCNPEREVREKVEQGVQELADRGYRALGVARTSEKTGEWEFLGVLSLFDPPREDTKATIKTAQSMGIKVKMVTGDQVAIAKETCRSLGMGTGILDSAIFHDDSELRGASISEVVKDAHGFAEVYPEHKFRIVKVLMEQGYTVGMTGDGVNDAPALKRANIGIAVEGATDAARAAADIVLTDPGLKTIIEAILLARKIFARVRNYCIYRISGTFQMIGFFFFAVIAFKSAVCAHFPEQQRQIDASKAFFGALDIDASFEPCFTLPVIALVAITLLNDGLILSICKDNVEPSNRPQVWDLREIFTVASGLGFFLVLQALALLLIGIHGGSGANAGESCGQNPKYYDEAEADIVNSEKCTGFVAYWLGDSEYGSVTYQELKTIMYLCLSLSGFVTVLSARTRGFFWERRTGGLLGGASVVAFIITVVIAMNMSAVHMEMDSLNWNQVIFVSVYTFVWFVAVDILVKRSIYRCFDWYYLEKELKNGNDLLQALVSNNMEEERLTSRRTTMGARASNLTGKDGLPTSALARRSHSASNSADVGAGGFPSPMRTSWAVGDRPSNFGFDRKTSREAMLEKKLEQLEKIVQAMQVQLEANNKGRKKDT